ncbi:MAG: GIY-YIG nuclease family protein [Methylacidiphilales bacterium]|nr:GIY-YIG nuclease family protein [Candidatus Methylacidiphilales bacterium]
MAWAYILKGSNGRHYIGSAVDFEVRFAQHQRGHTYSTKRLGTILEIVAKREYPTLKEARAVERKLKAKKNPILAIYMLENG